MQNCSRIVAAFLLATASLLAAAQAPTVDPDPDDGIDGLLCPNSDLWGTNLFTNICWGCIFPIKICGGVTIRAGAREIPDEASTSSICSCPDPLGIPSPGCHVGYFEHSHLIDVTRSAYCSPALGGIHLQDSSVRNLGGPKLNTGGAEGPRRSFYNYMYYAFPLNVMLDLVVDTRCGSDGYLDFDVMYMSPLDPTWNDDEMAFFLNLESLVFSNPVSQAACLADSAKLMAGGQPIDRLMWCVGNWGNMYPFTGNIIHSSGPVTDSSLITARTLAAMHRRGLARKTVGRDAMCRSLIYPTLPKTQYRLGMLYPVAESTDNHYIGEPSIRWGEWRSIPATGEDFSYVITRWSDCCVTFGAD